MTAAHVSPNKNRGRLLQGVLKMRPIIPVLALAVATLCPVAILAADPTPEQRFLSDSHLRQNVVATAARSTVMLRHACQNAAYSPADPVELIPMKFDAFGGPTSGALKFPVAETGCGASRQLNVYLWVQQENSIAISPMLPGSSRADSGLQQQAYPYVMAAAGGPEANCSTAYVEDTLYDGPPADGTQPWKETWTLSSCGWRAEVPVNFTPGPNGVKITAGPKKAVKKLPASS